MDSLSGCREILENLSAPYLLIQSHELQPWLRQNSRRLQDLSPGSMTSQPLNQPQTPQIWVFQSPKPSAAKTQAQLTAPQLQGRVRAPSHSLVWIPALHKASLAALAFSSALFSGYCTYLHQQNKATLHLLLISKGIVKFRREKCQFKLPQCFLVA